MDYFFPEPKDGPRTSARARQALAEAREGLTEARHDLLAAGEVEWVSSAATRYRALLEDTLGAATRLNVALAGACAAVLRHTGAADAERDAAEAEAAACRIVLPVFIP